MRWPPAFAASLIAARCALGVEAEAVLGLLDGADTEVCDELHDEKSCPAGENASSCDAAELGPLNCLVNEKWVSATWPEIEARVAEAPMHLVAAVERAHRRAAVEYALEKARIEARSIAAVVAMVEATAAAKIRWEMADFAFIEDMDPADLIRDVEAAEPVAAAAAAEVNADESGQAGGIIMKGWDGDLTGGRDSIRLRAQNLLVVWESGEAVEGPAQRMDAALRGMKAYLRGHGLENPTS